jgi:cephalosporin hydroxylase
MATSAALKKAEYHAKNSLRSLFVPGAIKALRAQTASASEPEALFEVVQNFRHRRIQIAASQLKEEICGLLKTLAARPPRTLVEIGVYKGGTLFLFTRMAAPDALIVSLDLPPIRLGVGYPPWRARLFRSFAQPSQKLELLQGDSHEPATVERLKRVLDGRSIDFLMIDGDHTYEGVKADYQMYHSLVARGGLIALHDIVPRVKHPCGVPQFWQEIKQTEQTREFVRDWKQQGYGIGVITKS